MGHLLSRKSGGDTVITREKAEDLRRQYEDITNESGYLITKQASLIDAIASQAKQAMSQEPPPKKPSVEGESKLINVPMQRSLVESILEFEKTYPVELKEIQKKKDNLKRSIEATTPMLTVQPPVQTTPPSNKGPRATSSSSGSTVQLYCERKGVFSEGITGRLSTIIQTNRQTLKMKIINDLNEVRSDLPLIAICINAARLGSDVDQGLHNVNDHINMAKVACLVIHIKEEHALPITASREVLTARARELGVMLDAAYTDDLGFYNCAMNDNAQQNVFAFIQAN